MSVNSRSGQEKTFPADQSLISATDLDGRIIYCNDTFCAVSGYSRDELVGSHHNIVRHPDMPKAAFATLWRYLKAGKSWMGLVKNRCKNGDYYWVSAYITPIVENGRITGYESVRVCPSREQIAKAEALYRQLQAGKASRYNLDLASLPITAIAVLLGSAAIWAAQAWGPDWLFIASLPAILVLLVAALHKRQHARLEQIIQQAPGAFADPVSAAVFSPYAGALGRLDMVLQANAARLQTSLGRTIDYALQVDTAAEASCQLSSNSARALQERSSELAGTVCTVQQLTDSIDAVVSSIEDVSAQTCQASDLAVQGTRRANASREAIESLANTVQAIDQSVQQLATQSSEINSMASVIAGIAEQTNLLALNAAIEAARAGDEGRGFAVVADEVRNLAMRTQDSTEQIHNILAQLQGCAADAVQIAHEGLVKAGQGVEQVTQSQQELQDIGQLVQNIAQRSQSMLVSAQQQVATTREVQASMERIASGVDQTATESQLSMQCGEQLLQVSRQLRNLVERFRRS